VGLDVHGMTSVPVFNRWRVQVREIREARVPLVTDQSRERKEKERVTNCIGDNDVETPKGLDGFLHRVHTVLFYSHILHHRSAKNSQKRVDPPPESATP